MKPGVSRNLYDWNEACDLPSPKQSVLSEFSRGCTEGMSLMRSLSISISKVTRRSVFVLACSMTAASGFAVGQDVEDLIPPPPTARSLQESQQMFPPSPGELAQETDLERAERQLREFLAQNPDHQEAHVRLALVMSQQGRTNEAIEYLDAIRQQTGGARISMGLGQIYLNQDEVCWALDFLREARAQDPELPDLNYWMGTAELKAGWPLQSFWTLSDFNNSNEEFGWAQQLVRGSSLASLGLQCEASGDYSAVYEAAGENPIGLRALELHQRMDQALCERERFRGSLKVGFRYDDNPGIVPTTNIFGTPGVINRSAGNSYVGAFSYDLLREYNRDIVAGYNILHTSNYEAHESDILDNAVWIAGTQRGLIGWQPYSATLRFDYDHLGIGSDSFLGRYGVTPSFTLHESDFESSTLLFRYTGLDFLGQGAVDGTVFDADSNDYSFGIFRQHQSDCRDLTLFYGYLYDINESDGGNFDYEGHQIQTGIVWLLPWHDMQLNATGQFYVRDYDNPDATFGRRRNDEEYVAQVSLLYPLEDQLYLTLSYLYDRNDSNLPSGDYERNLIELGIQYNFPQGNVPNRGLIRSRSTY